MAALHGGPGLEAASPNDAYGAVEYAFETAEDDAGVDDATDHEMDVAAALVSCDADSGLFARGWAEAPRLRDELAAEHSADLDLYRQAVVRATQLLDP